MNKGQTTKPEGILYSQSFVCKIILYRTLRKSSRLLADTGQSVLCGLARTGPSLYTIEMRKRCNRVWVYSGQRLTLRFTSTASAGSGYAGIHADSNIVSDLPRTGNAWAYEPYECFDAVFPDGRRTSYGRIASGRHGTASFRYSPLHKPARDI